MAYDAAVAAGVDDAVIKLFVASVVRLDESWYVEALGMDRAEQRRMLVDAVDAIFPRLDNMLETMGADPYITAPMVAADTWTTYLSSLTPLRPERETSSTASDQLRNGSQSTAVQRQPDTPPAWASLSPSVAKLLVSAHCVICALG
jgi:acyl-CoA oxidase